MGSRCHSGIGTFFLVKNDEKHRKQEKHMQQLNSKDLMYMLKISEKIQCLPGGMTGPYATPFFRETCGRGRRQGAVEACNTGIALF